MLLQKGTNTRGVGISSMRKSIYRIAGNFRGVLIFVIFVTIRRVTKFSTHEFSVGYCACASQPGEYDVNRTHVLKGSNSYRNGSLSLSTPHRVRLDRSTSGVTKFKTTKINSEDPRQLFTKICTPENYPLYGTSLQPHPVATPLQPHPVATPIDSTHSH